MAIAVEEVGSEVERERERGIRIVRFVVGGG